MKNRRDSLGLNRETVRELTNGELVLGGNPGITNVNGSLCRPYQSVANGSACLPTCFCTPPPGA